MSDVLPVDSTITIRAEASLADPDSCEFTVNRTVHPGGPFFFDAKERAGGSSSSGCSRFRASPTCSSPTTW